MQYGTPTNTGMITHIIIIFSWCNTIYLSKLGSLWLLTAHVVSDILTTAINMRCSVIYLRNHTPVLPAQKCEYISSIF